MAKQTEVAIRGKDNLSAITKISNLSEAGSGPPLLDGSEDDVDGQEAAWALQSLQKLSFLKIVFLDIGISLGDVVTDLLQGISLIFESDWSLAATSNYGILVLVTCWLPGPLTLVHLCLRHSGLGWAPYRGLLGILWAVLCLLIYPLLPTLLYVGVLLNKRRSTDTREEQSNSDLEKKAREVKAITGVTESPIQVVLLGFLMLKGFLVFPWNQEASSFCIEDELGRRLCLPSIPMFSIFFSLASILKVCLVNY